MISDRTLSLIRAGLEICPGLRVRSVFKRKEVLQKAESGIEAVLGYSCGRGVSEALRGDFGTELETSYNRIW